MVFLLAPETSCHNDKLAKETCASNFTRVQTRTTQASEKRSCSHRSVCEKTATRNHETHMLAYKLWDKHLVVPKRSTNARSLHPLRGSICVTSAGCEPRQSVRVGKQSAHTCAQTPCLRNKKHRKVEHIELGLFLRPPPSICCDLSSSFPSPLPLTSPVPLPFGPPLQVLFFQSVLTSHIGSAYRSCFSVSTSCLGAPTLIRLSFLLLLSLWATDTVRHPSHQVLLPQGTQGDRNGASHLVFLSEKWFF